MNGFVSPLSAMLLAAAELSRNNIATIVFSPDGRYLVVTAVTSSFAYDLERRQPIALGGKLHDLTQLRMSFLGPDQLFLTGEATKGGLYSARILSFPDGRVLKETVIGDQQLESVSKGKLLIVSPLKDYSAGLLDPDLGKFTGAYKLPAVDAWDANVAVEDATGGLLLGQIGTPNVSRIPLPLGPLPNPRAAIFSADGKYLAVSTRNRAAIWDLATGKQMNLIRPFRSGWMNDTDELFGQFPKFRDRDAIDLEISLSPHSSKELLKYEDEDLQYRDLQLHFKPLGKGKATSRNVKLEVTKMNGTTVAWSRDFPRELPACWPAEDNRLVLAWDLSNDAVKAEVKNSPALQSELNALKDHKKGLLLETVVPDTGAPLQQVIVPEANMSESYSDERRALVSGEFVLARGDHNTTTIYRLSDGSKIGQFFGHPLATDAASGLIAASNREDEIMLVDEHSGAERGRFSLGSPIRAAQIIGSKDKTLLVLTADQLVHRLPLPQ